MSDFRLPACAFILAIIVSVLATDVAAQPRVASTKPTTKPTTKPATAATTQQGSSDLIKRGVIRVSQRQRLRITHATTVTPQGAAMRVVHALPVKAPWSIANVEHGLDKLSAEPSMPAVKFDDKSGGYYFEWEAESPVLSGPTKFVTSYELMTAAREFNAAHVRATWDQMDPPRLDKSEEGMSAITDELVKLVTDARKRPNPLMAIPLFVNWVQTNIAYDERVGYKSTDVASILSGKRGHCGHRSTAFQFICTMAGIRSRTAWGFQISKREGLWDGHGDWNRHTWVEIDVPGIGWVEVEPAVAAKGRSPFFIPNTYIQNRYLQSAHAYTKAGPHWRWVQFDLDTIDIKPAK